MAKKWSPELDYIPLARKNWPYETFRGIVSQSVTISEICFKCGCCEKIERTREKIREYIIVKKIPYGHMYAYDRKSIEKQRDKMGKPKEKKPVTYQYQIAESNTVYRDFALDMYAGASGEPAVRPIICRILEGIKDEDFAKISLPEITKFINERMTRARTGYIRRILAQMYIQDFNGTRDKMQPDVIAWVLSGIK